jgi:excisionase family DNA binding protein
MVTMAEPRLLTVAEIAEQLRVSTPTVTSWLRTGRLKGYRVGGKRAGWRIEEEDFRAFHERLKRGQIPVDSE